MEHSENCICHLCLSGQSRPVLIEGLELPKKLEFGNKEHIKLRDRIERRAKIRTEGLTCPCGEIQIKPVKAEGERLHWQCGCGWCGNTDRDVENGL